MLILLLNKLLLLILFLCILNVVRHSYYFIQVILQSNENLPQKYLLDDKSLLLLGLSISYILVTIFSGVSI